MNFHLTTNPEKSKGNTFGKILKTLIFGHFGPILPEKKNFLEKFGSDSFYIYISVQNQEKTKNN